jgi:hypothetical protein
MGFSLILVGPVASKDYMVEKLELSKKRSGDLFKTEQILVPFVNSSAFKGKEIGMVIAPYEPATIYAPG